MKFAWCGFLHKWNEHWPAWLHIDNKIILRYRSLCRYCQGKLDMMNRLFYRLTILALILTLIFLYGLERAGRKRLVLYYLTLFQNNPVSRTYLRRRGREGPWKEKAHLRVYNYQTNTGETFSPVSKHNFLRKRKKKKKDQKSYNTRAKYWNVFNCFAFPQNENFISHSCWLSVSVVICIGYTILSTQYRTLFKNLTHLQRQKQCSENCIHGTCWDKYYFCWILCFQCYCLTFRGKEPLKLHKHTLHSLLGS